MSKLITVTLPEPLLRKIIERYHLTHIYPEGPANWEDCMSDGCAHLRDVLGGTFSIRGERVGIQLARISRRFRDDAGSGK